jgi:hypothetical protein
MNNYNDNNNNIKLNIDNNLLKNMASSIDLDNLNGTNLMDLNNQPFQQPTFNMPHNFPPINNPYALPTETLTMPSNTQDKQLIQSITRELINNLKENNISLHDDNTIQHRQIRNENYSNLSSNDIDDLSDKKKSKKQNKYKDDIKKGVEHMLSTNGIPSSENVSSYFFDDMFNLKDFVILFGVYFLLSQEMIKDLFAQYFTSLNPDDETGKIHIKGVIIYGLILSIMFMVIKKLV